MIIRYPDSSFHNSIGMEFVLIPSGSFVMGRDPLFEEDRDDELPQHKVNISKPFYLGKYQVTQAQWVAVMEDNPSGFKGPANPVEQVSWNDAQEFIKRLNVKEGHNRYRLPTEAEWEYAARAGADTVYFFGNDENILPVYAWFIDNSRKTPHPVGKKRPNAWGLYDVHGNVWEWVQDQYGEEYYATSPTTDPKGPVEGSWRVFRGGSWYNNAGSCRSGYRSSYSPGNRRYNLGFRLALSPEQGKGAGQPERQGAEWNGADWRFVGLLSIVDGEILYLDGRFTRFSYPDLLAEMREIRKGIWEMHGALAKR